MEIFTDKEGRKYTFIKTEDGKLALKILEAEKPIDEPEKVEVEMKITDKKVTKKISKNKK